MLLFSLRIEQLWEITKVFSRCERSLGVSGDGGRFVSEMCLVAWKIFDPSHKMQGIFPKRGLARITELEGVLEID